MKSLRAALILAAVVSLPAAIGVLATDVSARVSSPAAQTPATNSHSDRERFVGTYSLVTTEVKDANGKWTQTPNFNSIGYITYSDGGHMGVHIMPKVRARFAAAQPTPEEAQKALQGYTAYFGSFNVDDKDKVVVHHRVGQINPGGDVDARRFYEFVTDQRGIEQLI